jgi:hypothetical protein
VLWLVLRDMLTLLATGLLIGVPYADLLSWYVPSQLFGVAPTDFERFGGNCDPGVRRAVVGHCAGPARRRPLTALRHE